MNLLYVFTSQVERLLLVFFSFRFCHSLSIDRLADQNRRFFLYDLVQGEACKKKV